MVKLKIVSFKRWFLWYAACEIPSIDPTPLYYDNTPTVTLTAPVTLSAVGLSQNSVNKKILDKLQQYFKKKGESI